MVDPVFSSRAELEAWAQDRARRAMTGPFAGTLAAYRAAIDDVRRVTLAHVHLED